MHHVTLDGTGPDERDLHYEIIEATRLEARQRVHLRAALHLEHTDRIRTTQIIVHRLVGAIELAEVDRHTARASHIRETVLHHGEHPQPEQVDLHQPDRIEIVLLPLDDGAVLHTRGLDRHHGAQRLLGEHESAYVDAAMTRRGVEPLDDVGETLHARVVRVEIGAFEQRLGVCCVGCVGSGLGASPPAGESLRTFR